MGHATHMADSVDFDWDAIPLKAVAAVPTKHLTFDVNNPRYTPDKELPHTTEEEIIEFYHETSDLDELLLSISSSGYIGIEPMVVMAQDGSEKAVVLEGNRRLAAVKLLRSNELAARVGVSVPSMADALRSTLETVTIYRVASKTDAREYIGFKHINGAHKWDSLAKAKYALAWLEDEEAEVEGDPAKRLRQIAKKMGDGHSTLLRLVNGMRVLKQAEEQGLWKIEDRKKYRQFAFSHLYTALTRGGYRSYLGLADVPTSTLLPPNPIEPGYREELKQVLVWLYGVESEDISPIIRSQNPDLNRLSEVLEKPSAKRRLELGASLDQAHAEIRPPTDQFETALVTAVHSLEKAVGKSSSYNGDSALLEYADDAVAKSKQLRSIMNAAKSEPLEAT